MLSSVKAVYDLTDEQTKTYYSKYGGARGNWSIANRKAFIGKAIGCGFI